MDSIRNVCQICSFPGAAGHCVGALLGVLITKVSTALHNGNIILHLLVHQKFIGVLIQELHILVIFLHLVHSIVLIEHIIEPGLLLLDIVVSVSIKVISIILIKSFTMLFHEESELFIHLVLTQCLLASIASLALITLFLESLGISQGIESMICGTHSRADAGKHHYLDFFACNE